MTALGSCQCTNVLYLAASVLLLQLCSGQTRELASLKWTTVVMPIGGDPDAVVIADINHDAEPVEPFIRWAADPLPAKTKPHSSCNINQCRVLCDVIPPGVESGHGLLNPGPNLLSSAAFRVCQGRDQFRLACPRRGWLRQGT
jgi:hypothetical protein